jgi:hypothetical protein
MTPRRLAIFTICSNNYAAYARVFLASARRHHPEADLFLCVVDRMAPAAQLYHADVTLIALDALRIDDLAEFTFRYDILELNTAVKPFAFLHLLRDHGYDQVLYFDPDIEIHARLTSVLQALADGASLVMTPHCCAPNDSDPSDDLTLLRAGAFNLGFLGAARCAETMAVLCWWARHLRHSCIDDQASGLFVDQKFMDLAPVFAPHAHISRDTTLNVAYWNLTQRRLGWDGSCWTVDGRPLGFFHFSGIDPRRPDRLSIHTRRFHAPFAAALGALLERYIGNLLAAGHGREPADAYAFGHFASGVPIHRSLRQLFRTQHQMWPEDPFATFEAMLHLPLPGATLDAAPFVATDLIGWMHGLAPWLKGRYDLTRPEDVRAVVLWFLRHAMRDFGLDPRLVAPAAALVGHRPPRRMPPPRGGAGMDVSVIGYLRAASGVGEAARRTLRCLAGGSGLRVEGLDVALNVVCSRDDESCGDHLAEEASGRVQIFHINADQLAEVTDAMRDRLRPDAYRICVPFWELADIPDAWVTVMDRVDEIWAPSRFVQTMFAGRVDKPVIHMPPALEPPAASAHARRDFALPAGGFLFFFAFDFLSYPARKNPMAAIAAFRMAFPTTDTGVGLVIKTLNGTLDAPGADRLREMAAADARIVLVDRTLTRRQMTDLTASCDCVLSLHRSEGFGLLIAEAMMLGRPVIATDYGATAELLTPATGFPVAFRMVRVGENDYPFASGQSWADPDLPHAAWQMRTVRNDPVARAARTQAARCLMAARHGTAPVAAMQRNRLRELGLLSA